MKAYGLAWLLLAGCAAHSDTSSMPRPGTGIAEYREVANQAHRAVADIVDALEALRDRPREVADPQVTRFDGAFSQLELTSMKARTKAEAIIARGQNYFDEWKEQLTGGANQASAQADYNRLYDHFTRIRQASGEVRNQFRPFMASLRQFRGRLDQPVAGDAAARASEEEIGVLATNGRRVLQALESISTALKEAEIELHATRYSKR
jgi:uncharacterized protein YukE